MITRYNEGIHMSVKHKPELTWIGKEKRPKLQPRILLEDSEKSYHAPHHITDNDIFDNQIIFGENLKALKSLKENYEGKVRCIYIDPPYNIGRAFKHYNDKLGHSTWLTIMRDRIEALRLLLSDDGSMWISIDDDESHYLKVLCDEVFQRNNFIANVIWQKKYSQQNHAKWLSDNHDHILVYAKNKKIWRPNLLPRTEEMDKRYKNPDNDPRGNWIATSLNAKGGSKTSESFKYTFKNGAVLSIPSGRHPIYSKNKLAILESENRIFFGKNGDANPTRKTYLSEVKQGLTAVTIWSCEDVGHNDKAKKEVKLFNSNDVFDTPKPEKLIQRILHLATNPGDLVLDCFAGSGTTGAVAHKMGRRWIMIELGEHCHTHIIPRLQKVIDGTDQGGISKAVDWKGGGGFHYYTIGKVKHTQIIKSNKSLYIPTQGTLDFDMPIGSL